MVIRKKNNAIIEIRLNKNYDKFLFGEIKVLPNRNTEK